MLRKALYLANVVLGLWLVASPFALNFRNVDPAFYNSVIVGVAVAAVALASWFADGWTASHSTSRLSTGRAQAA